jgi:hypothetical protein
MAERTGDELVARLGRVEYDAGLFDTNDW